jgi:hypothetical protein
VKAKNVELIEIVEWWLPGAGANREVFLKGYEVSIR